MLYLFNEELRRKKITVSGVYFASSVFCLTRNSDISSTSHMHNLQGTYTETRSVDTLQVGTAYIVT